MMLSKRLKRIVAFSLLNSILFFDFAARADDVSPIPPPPQSNPGYDIMQESNSYFEKVCSDPSMGLGNGCEPKNYHDAWQKLEFDFGNSDSVSIPLEMQLAQDIDQIQKSMQPDIEKLNQILEKTPNNQYKTLYDTYLKVFIHSEILLVESGIMMLGQLQYPEHDDRYQNSLQNELSTQILPTLSSLLSNLSVSPFTSTTDASLEQSAEFNLNQAVVKMSTDIEASTNLILSVESNLNLSLPESDAALSSAWQNYVQANSTGFQSNSDQLSIFGEPVPLATDQQTSNYYSHIHDDELRRRQIMLNNNDFTGDSDDALLEKWLQDYSPLIPMEAKNVTWKQFLAPLITPETCSHGRCLTPASSNSTYYNPWSFEGAFDTKDWQQGIGLKLSGMFISSAIATEFLTRVIGKDVPELVHGDFAGFVNRYQRVLSRINWPLIGEVHEENIPILNFIAISLKMGHSLAVWFQWPVEYKSAMVDIVIADVVLWLLIKKGSSLGIQKTNQLIRYVGLCLTNMRLSMEARAFSMDASSPTTPLLNP